MAPKVEAVTAPVRLGEGPHWAHAQQALYFVSIFDCTLHKYVPATGAHTRSELDGMPTFIIPIEGKTNHFAVGLDRKVVEVEWSGGDHAARVLRTVVEVDQEYPDNRLNDAKADPRGRLFAGTMGHEYVPGQFRRKRGSLYRVGSGGARRLAGDLDISNGMCWDERERAFYYADSLELAVRRYTYDVHTGDISDPRIVFKLTEHGLAGIADGMTIDTDGNLWVANFDGSQVLNIDPRTGRLLQKVAIPALQVTSLTFGGQDLDVLYVTTASLDRGQEQRPPAGATFVVTGLGVRGHHSVSANI